MLDKIENIVPGSDYQKSSGNQEKSGYKRFLSNSYSSVSDSISLSPAILFLSSINWELKHLRIDKDKLNIAFTFDNIEFSSDLMISEIVSIEKIDYLVKYPANSQINTNYITLKLSSSVMHSITDSSPIKYQMLYLTKFCMSVIEAYGYNSGLSIDSIQVQDIYSEFEYEMKSEFAYLDKCLINFLEKYLTLKISSGNEYDPNKSELKLKYIQLNKM
jgi:hypothetical protein